MSKNKLRAIADAVREEEWNSDLREVLVLILGEEYDLEEPVPNDSERNEWEQKKELLTKALAHALYRLNEIPHPYVDTDFAFLNLVLGESIDGSPYEYTRIHGRR